MYYTVSLFLPLQSKYMVMAKLLYFCTFLPVTSSSAAFPSASVSLY